MVVKLAELIQNVKENQKITSHRESQKKYYQRLKISSLQDNPED
jgi:hypothetical protein